MTQKGTKSRAVGQGVQQAAAEMSVFMVSGYQSAQIVVEPRAFEADHRLALHLVTQTDQREAAEQGDRQNQQ
ncbi:hypothetical protein Q3H58_003604 [Pseudomonas psychrotolerans]|nr:hypothetical protein [Pseudomonas psychrotolerans]